MSPRRRLLTVRFSWPENRSFALTNWLTKRSLESELEPLMGSLNADGCLESATPVTITRHYAVGLTEWGSGTLVITSKEVVVDIAKVAIPALFTFLAGWLARSSRRVYFKVGDIEAGAETLDQLKKLMPLIKRNHKAPIKSVRKKSAPTAKKKASSAAPKKKRPKA